MVLDDVGHDRGAAPLAELVRDRQLLRVVPRQEAAKNLADGSAGVAVGFDADADVDAVVGLGEEPAVVRREVGVEEHLDDVRAEREILEPGHARVEEVAGARVGGEAGVGAVGGEDPAGAEVFAGDAHADGSAVFEERSEDAAVVVEGRAGGDGFGGEESVEPRAIEHDGAAGADEDGLAAAGRAEADAGELVGLCGDFRPEAGALEDLAGAGGDAAGAGLQPGEGFRVEEEAAQAAAGSLAGGGRPAGSGSDDDEVPGAIGAQFRFRKRPASWPTASFAVLRYGSQNPPPSVSSRRSL